MSDEYDDFDDNDCWNCGGEGFVAHCEQEFACMYPDEGCDYCMRRCDFCNPAPRNPELDRVLAEALQTPTDRQQGKDVKDAHR